MRLRPLALALLTACVSSPASGPDAGGVVSDAGSPDAGTSAQPLDCGAPAGAVEDVWTADPRTCFVRWASDVSGARGLAFAPNGDLFVVSRGRGIVVLFDADGDGVSSASERTLFAADSSANHGLAFHDGFLYASSESSVFRWSYASGQRQAQGRREVVVQGLPTGGHSTRTIVFEPTGKLLVSIGSAGNVDNPGTQPSTERALIRRFDLAQIPAGGIPAASGEIFATGLRNEVGLAFDAQGRLWGVENGRDQLVVHGEDIHDENPAEELHRFDPQPGLFYGYPFCWTQGIWPGHGDPGTQHVDPDVPGGKSEAFCQDPQQVRPPAAALGAHLAPLGLAFRGGELFIGSHGSWNATPPVGRMLLRATVAANGAVTGVAPFLGEKAADGSLRQGTWKYRPVDVKLGPDGALYVSDDAAGTVHRVVLPPAP